jgi:hypothetical protein
MGQGYTVKSAVIQKPYRNCTRADTVSIVIWTGYFWHGFYRQLFNTLYNEGSREDIYEGVILINSIKNNIGSDLRISNKYGRQPWDNDPTKHIIICPRRWGFKSSLAHHWSEIFLEIRHQFHTSILLSHWILIDQQTSIWNLGSDAYLNIRHVISK